MYVCDSGTRLHDIAADATRDLPTGANGCVASNRALVCMCAIVAPVCVALLCHTS